MTVAVDVTVGVTVVVGVTVDVTAAVGVMVGETLGVGVGDGIGGADTAKTNFSEIPTLTFECFGALHSPSPSNPPSFIYPYISM